MNRSLAVLVSMFLACSVFGQDAPQTKTEPAPSLLSIHLAPGVSVRNETLFGDTGDVAIWAGPTVGMSLIGRFPPVPWLIGSLALFGEYNPATYKGYNGTYFAFAGYAQLGVLFDIVPAFSLGALVGPGYGYGSWQVSAPHAGSGAGFSALAGIFGWYRISPLWSLGAEVGTAQMPIEYGDRIFFTADVGYHFSKLASSAAQEAAPQPSTPQPSTPQPERQRQPSSNLMRQSIRGSVGILDTFGDPGNFRLTAGCTWTYDFLSTADLSLGPDLECWVTGDGDLTAVPILLGVQASLFPSSPVRPYGTGVAGVCLNHRVVTETGLVWLFPPIYGPQTKEEVNCSFAYAVGGGIEVVSGQFLFSIDYRYLVAGGDGSLDGHLLCITIGWLTR